jgi:hypothetical protein
MKLFGRTWDRRSLLARVGDLRQIGGAVPITLQDGPERGVRAIDVRTGTGFRFVVLPDRGLDVWMAEYQGASLAWLSPTGPLHPAFFEPEGLGWLRGFAGGLSVTCGLTYLGPPHVDQGRALGLHGRASYLPAREVAVLENWEGDDYRIEIRGRIREAAVFGEHVTLTRRLSTALGENRLFLEDTVENLGAEPVPHMVLYHVNGGFPLLDETAELLTASSEVRPANAVSEREPGDFARFLPPSPGYPERLYFHTLRAGPDGRTAVALVNRGFQGGRGLGYLLRFPVSALPCFTEWKMMGPGTYVVGTEPGNVHPVPRERLRREGTLPFLAPGERRRYEIEFRVLASPEEIGAAEAEIRSLDSS